MLTLPVTKKKKAQIKGARKGRSKGSRGESIICKIFSTWYGVPNSFLRTRTSGAQFKNSEPGDIVVPSKFTLVIEVKNTEVWDFSELFDNTKVNHILSYFKQAETDCLEYNATKHITKIKKYPIAIFTKNYHLQYCIIDINNFDFNNFEIPYDNKIIWSSKFIIFRLQEFLKKNTLTIEEKGIRYG